MGSNAGTPSRRRSQSPHAFDDGQITTSYRSAFGGPSGLAADTWTSRMSSGNNTPSHLSRQQSLSHATAYLTAMSDTPTHSSSPYFGTSPRFSGATSAAMDSLTRRLESVAVADELAHATEATNAAIGDDTDAISFMTAVDDNAALPTSPSTATAATPLEPIVESLEASPRFETVSQVQQQPHDATRSSPSAHSQVTTEVEVTAMFAPTTSASSTSTVQQQQASQSKSESVSGGGSVWSLPPPRDEVGEGETTSRRYSYTKSTAAPAQEASPAIDSPADAANRAGRLVSTLTTGTASEQQEAAEALLKASETHGHSVREAAYLAGGAHMLQEILLNSPTTSKNTGLRDACTAALAELCQHPDALAEVTNSSGSTGGSAGVSRLVGVALEGVSSGHDASKHLFIALTTAKGDGVRGACAEHKAVRMLTGLLGNPNTTSNTKENAMQSLEALCDADAGASLRKLAWGGGLSTLTKATLHSAALRPSGMRLLLRAVGQDSRHAETLCTVECIQALALLIADDEYSLGIQAAAARILAVIAALPSRREDATQALLDFALPRACEILHQARSCCEHVVASSEDADGGASSSGGCAVALAPPQVLVEAVSRSNHVADEQLVGHLRAACAALVGHLSKSSKLCCHVVIFHAEVLQPLVALLATSAQCVLAGEVLKATAAYAATPNAMM